MVDSLPSIKISSRIIFRPFLLLIDFFRIGVYLPNSNHTRIEIICPVDTFTLWYKERTLKGLRSGQFSYKADKVYLKPLRTSTINKLRYLYCRLRFYILQFSVCFNLLVYCQDNVFEWRNRILKLAKGTLMNRARVMIIMVTQNCA